jgi:hypothetical protein
LNEQIWLWLQGKKTYDELPEANKWDYFVLTGGHFRNESEYWDRVHQAVLNGEIEVSPEKVHYFDDGPLIVSGEWWSHYKARRMRAALVGCSDRRGLREAQG